MSEVLVQLLGSVVLLNFAVFMSWIVRNALQQGVVHHQIRVYSRDRDPFSYWCHTSLAIAFALMLFVGFVWNTINLFV